MWRCQRNIKTFLHNPLMQKCRYATNEAVPVRVVIMPLSVPHPWSTQAHHWMKLNSLASQKDDSKFIVPPNKKLLMLNNVPVCLLTWPLNEDLLKAKPISWRERTFSRIVQYTVNIWQSMGQPLSPSSNLWSKFMFRIHQWGEAYLATIPYCETCWRQIATAKEDGQKIHLSSFGTLSEKGIVRSLIFIVPGNGQWLKDLQPIVHSASRFHRRRLFYSIFTLPWTILASLLPGPNVLFCGVAYRIYCHLNAYRGSTWLHHRLLHGIDQDYKSSEKLNETWKKVSKDIPTLPWLSDDAFLQMIESVQSPTNTFTERQLKDWLSQLKCARQNIQVLIEK